MNILVVGGTRFMGKHLVAALLEKGHEVTVANRGVTPDNFTAKVKRLIIDRTDASSIKNNIPDICYDICYDTIAYCSNDVKALLDNIKCKKYIQISTCSVYPDLKMDTVESGFDPHKNKLVYCSRTDFSYDEIKRQAETAIVQDYSHIPSVMVRPPYVIGNDDYTKRLYFYVKHIIDGQPMFVDNLDEQIAFVRSDEEGKFLAFLGETDFTGVVNGSSEQSITLSEVISYVKEKTGKEAVLAKDGEPAPYNGCESFSMNTELSKSLGFFFTPLREWIFDLLDDYIMSARQSE